MAISPYTRRGHVDSTCYNQTGMVKTIELMLGLPPMNQLDLSATPMRGPSSAPHAEPANAVASANADTVMNRSNMSLLAEVFPGVPTKGNLSANGTLLSIEKAKRMLGFSPQYSWRNEVAKG